MKYTSSKHINPKDENLLSKYHPSPVYIDTVSLDSLSEEISHSTSMTKADVKAVIEELVVLLQKNLVMGMKIKVDGLGTFKISFGGTGHEKAEDVSASDISGVKVTFVADSRIKKFISANLSFVKDSKIMKAEEKNNTAN